LGETDAVAPELAVLDYWIGSQGPLDSPARLLAIMIVTDIRWRDIGHDHGLVDIAPVRS